MRQVFKDITIFFFFSFLSFFFENDVYAIAHLRIGSYALDFKTLFFVLIYLIYLYCVFDFLYIIFVPKSSPL